MHYETFRIIETPFKDQLGVKKYLFVEKYAAQLERKEVGENYKSCFVVISKLTLFRILLVYNRNVERERKST